MVTVLGGLVEFERDPIRSRTGRPRPGHDRVNRLFIIFV